MKPDADVERLRKLMGFDSQFIEQLAEMKWNPRCSVPFELWLTQSQSKADRQRLLQLGNAVVPHCAAVALALLARS